MANNADLLKKKDAVGADSGGPVVDRDRLNLIKATNAKVKLPRMDEILERTVGSCINISEPLTRREAEILRFIVTGKTNKEIARALCRTERTIEYHRNRLMRKLGAHNAAELVKRAIVLGLV